MLVLRRRYVARGLVQGIGYRWFVSDAADKLAVTGWVRNLPDGAVEIEAQSDSKTLSGFEAELRCGHPAAKVRALQAQEMPPAEGEKNFRILA
ncbi:MAG: acylphosphatase [Elusimicrobiales bacterium]